MIKLIPQISKKIEKVLKKLKLKPKERPQDFIKRTKKTKHRYFSLCENEKGKKLIFYARIFDSFFDKKRMETEIKIAKVLKRKKINLFPQYFESKIEKDFEWLTREYFLQSPLEDEKEIEKLKRNLTQKEIEKIAKGAFSLTKIKISDFPFLEKFKIKEYLNLEKEIERKKILERKEIEKLKKLLEKNRELLEKENRYFCHGDFHIGNILIFNGKLKILDLESAKINNFAFDIAFFYTRLWKEKKVREKILNSFLSLLPKKFLEKFKILFKIDCLFIGYHSFLAQPKEYSKKIIQKRKNFYLNFLKRLLLFKNLGEN